VRWRLDVGVGNIRIRDSSGRDHTTDAVALRRAVEKSDASCVAQSSRAVAERCRGGGALNLATKPILITRHLPAAIADRQTRPVPSRYVALSDYWALTKPEVNFLIAFATFAGFYLALPAQASRFPWMLLIHTLLGTLLVASGTGALNQYIERRFDAQMCRTSRRPLAAGRLDPSRVLWFGVAVSAVGSIYLAIAVNLLASGLSIVTLLTYLFLYTPLKRKTPLCTIVGAVPGAVPPLIGWAAASGTIGSEAWVLSAVVFLWQFPHFMAIAWMYREDYRRAGYCVLPEGEARHLVASLQTIMPLLALFPTALLPAWGQARIFYGLGASLLNLAFFYYGARFVHHRSSSAARRLLTASIIYLPSILALMSLRGVSSGPSG
jgi:heme o synthase